MKSTDVRTSTCIEFDVEYRQVYKLTLMLEILINDDVKISKYKNIFGKNCTPNWSGEVFVINEVKANVPGTYVTEDFNFEEIIGMFYKKNCKKQMKQSLELRK